MSRRDPLLDQRAAQMILRESRYRFPVWLRAGLVGFALGLIVAGATCYCFHGPLLPADDSSQIPHI